MDRTPVIAAPPADANAALRHRMMARLGLSRARRAVPACAATLEEAGRLCAACDRASPCATWLDFGGGDRAPSFCRIRAQLERLATGS